MHTKIKLSMLGGGLLIAGVLVVGGTGPAFADTPQEAPLVASIPGAPSGVAAIQARLDGLVGTQTDSELLAIVNSGKPSESLYDSSGKLVAAFYTDVPLFSPQTITQRGPGCASTDACATGAVSYGYYGTGQKSISIGGITRIFAGSNSTTWWTGGTGTFLAPNVGKNYVSGQSYTSITRS